MYYKVLDSRTGAVLDTLDLHVLARAYYAAWRVMNGPAPLGPHRLPMLHVLIDYGSRAKDDDPR